jgi:hypothetical protein
MIIGERSIDTITFLVIVFLLSIVVEAVTEILTASELTEPFRKKWKAWAYPINNPPPDTYFQKFKVWVDKLISCGYCTSVWVAGFFGIWAAKIDFGYWFINWIVIVFSLHRVATWVHVVFELVKKGRVRTHDLEVSVLMRNSEVDNGGIGQSSPEEPAEVEQGHLEAGGSQDSV